MTQHINLLRKQRLMPPSLLWGGLVVIVLVAAQAGYGLWLMRGNAETEARVQQQETELTELRARLALAGMRSASVTQLQQDITRLTPLARSYEVLLEQIATGRVGLRDGYLDHLTTLARTVSPKVWVTQVSLGEAGRKFSLQGQALDEDSVLDYVDRLNAAYAARGLALVTLDMSVQTPPAAGSAGPAGATRPQPPSQPQGGKTITFRLN